MLLDLCLAQNLRVAAIDCVTLCTVEIIKPMTKYSGERVHAFT